ncbi:MAG: CCA tRNA nucleotidyltransferase, partial [cyanobacterium endosymbiont of Rhopalodia inflata]
YETRKTIRKLAPLIGQVAVERVQNELNYLLSNIRGSENLINAAKDGLFAPWFKQLTEDKLDQLIKIDQAVSLLKENLNQNNFRHFLNYYLDDFEYYPSTIRQAKLAVLASSIPNKAELELVNLKYPRVDIRNVTQALNHLPILQKNQGNMNLRELYFFFLKVGEVFPVLAILTLAKRIDSQAIFSLIYRYLDPKDQVVHPSSLVTGHDLIEHLNLKPSPKIGELLTEIKLAYIEGKISTIEEAFELAKKS